MISVGVAEATAFAVGLQLFLTGVHLQPNQAPNQHAPGRQKLHAFHFFPCSFAEDGPRKTKKGRPKCPHATQRNRCVNIANSSASLLTSSGLQTGTLHLGNLRLFQTKSKFF